MRTGPTKESTRKTIVALEKAGKKTKNELLKKVAEYLNVSARKRTEVNLYKLSKIAGKNPGKVLIVPGKVLSNGEATEKMNVVCLQYSAKAKEKIEKMHGKIRCFGEVKDWKENAKEMVIVK